MVRAEDELAALLHPDPSLWQAPFELMVEDVLYLGFPVGVSSSTPKATSPSAAAAAQGTPDEAVPPASREEGQEAEAAALARIVGDSTFSGSTAVSSGDSLLMFHVVFVLDAAGVVDDAVSGQAADEAGPAQLLKSWLQTGLKRISLALHAEEMREGYVSQQAAALLAARDKWTEAPPLLHSTPDGASGPGAVHLSTDALLETWLSTTLLAEELVRIHHAVASGGTLRLRLNKWTTLSLPPATQRGGVRAAAEAAALQPYHTLLLLSPRESVLQSLPADGSSALRQVVRAVNISRTLRQLAMDIGADLDTVMDLAKHLVAWGVARKITTLHKYSRFVLAPAKASLQAMPGLSADFAAAFPGHSLTDALSSMEVLRGGALGTTLQGMDSVKRSEHVLKVLMWLCRHDLVVEVTTSLRFLPLKSMPVETASWMQQQLHSEESPPPTDGSSTDGSRESAHKWLTQHVAQKLQGPSGSDFEALQAATAVADHILAMLPYCTGTCSVEEMGLHTRIPTLALHQVADIVPDMLLKVRLGGGFA